MPILKHFVLFVVIIGILGYGGCEHEQEQKSSRRINSQKENNCGEKVDNNVESTQLFSELPWVIKMGDSYKWKQQISGDVVEIKILKIDSEKLRIWVRRPKYIKKNPLPPLTKVICEEEMDAGKSELPFIIVNNKLKNDDVTWKWNEEKKGWLAKTRIYNYYYYLVLIRPNSSNKSNVPDIGYQRVDIDRSSCYQWNLKWYRAL